MTWKRLTTARWQGLPCRFALCFYASSINTWYTQADDDRFNVIAVCSQFLRMCSLGVTGLAVITSRDEQQTRTTSAKTFTTQRSWKFRLWFWSDEMMTVWFRVPPGWLSVHLFDHLSLLYHNYVENHTFLYQIECVHTSAPDEGWEN